MTTERPRRLVTTREAALLLYGRSDRQTESNVRQLYFRGRLTRYGGGKRRQCFADLDEVNRLHHDWYGEPVDWVLVTRVAEVSRSA